MSKKQGVMLVVCLLGALAIWFFWIHPNAEKPAGPQPAADDGEIHFELPFAFFQDKIRVRGGVMGGGLPAICKEGSRFAIVGVREVVKKKPLSDTALKRVLVDDQGQRHQPIGYGFPSQRAPEAMPVLMTQGLFSGDLLIVGPAKSVLMLFYVVPADSKSFSLEADGTNAQVRLLDTWQPEWEIKTAGFMLNGSNTVSYPTIQQDGWGFQ